MDEKEIIANLVRIAEDEGVWGIEIVVCPPNNGAEPAEGARRYSVRLGTFAAVPDEPHELVSAGAGWMSGPVESYAAPAHTSELVRSPLVGIFHRSLEPDGPPLVEVGTVVEVGQTLCCVESLKVFREVGSTVSGVVGAVLAENEEAVDYGQPLFEVLPQADEED